MTSDSLTIYRARCLLKKEPTAKILLVADNARQLHAYERLLRFFLPQDPQVPHLPGENSKKVIVFPDHETLPYDVLSPPPGIISARIGGFYRLLNDDYDLLAVTIDTLIRRTAPVSHFISLGLSVRKGMEIARETFIRRLAESGYELCDRVRVAGQYAVRGSLLDLFPSSALFPYRLDWFDNKIESIRSFSPQDQRSLEDIDTVNLGPPNEFPLTPAARQTFVHNWQQRFSGEARRTPFYKKFKLGGLPGGAESYLPLFFAPQKCQSLFDYMEGSPKKKIFLLNTPDTNKLARQSRAYATERYREQRKCNPESILPVQELYLTDAEYQNAIANYAPFPSARNDQPKLASPDLKETNDRDTTAMRAEQLKHSIRAGERMLLTLNSPEKFELLKEELKTLNYRQLDDWDAFEAGSHPLCLMRADIIGGLRNLSDKWTLLTESDLFADAPVNYSDEATENVHHKNLNALIDDLTQIRPGDLLVHLDHGVGVFRELKPLNSGGVMQEFLSLEYADNTTLYIPANNLHLILRYTGIDGKDREPDKLGGVKWRRQSAAAMKRIADTAAELLSLYAARSARPGMRTAKPDKDYFKFAAAFPYTETPDQKAAIESVIKDMENEKSMDRLVCGDVGFGKTEVAMRASYLAAALGYQVALLVPTTLLANQHLESFKNRFAETAVKIASLTRFSGGQANTLREDFANGKYDIVIGTHALLGDRIKFKNLGLLIIDEEHRFGVRQKEKIKQLRVNLDVLSLTATPIPRTLNMAISGLRDISLIASPPKDRLAVKTFVVPYNEELRRDAIKRELRRGGQVYYVYNRIPRVKETVAELQKIFPDTVCAAIYGGMPKKDMESIMNHFYNNRIGILVCTTIIENGIDVPNANTMILERADRFGLAQLHQLRGRIGRREHQAYAYLMTEGMPTASGRDRLNALASAQELGVGFTLAAYDMRIRGVGDILSAEQSGDVQKIGMDLYSKLLESAIRNMRLGKNVEHENLLQSTETGVDVAISALLPEDYVRSPYERLNFYRRLADATGREMQQLPEELTDRFGPLPAETENLFALQKIKMRAKKLEVRHIKMNRGGGYLELSPGSAAAARCEETLRSRADIADTPYAYENHRLRIRKGFTTDVECIRLIKDALSVLADARESGTSASPNRRQLRA